MPLIQHNPTTTLITIMRYLKDHNLEESWLALEKETNIKLYNYPKEIDFLRKLILKGDFCESVKFMSTIQSYITNEEYKKCSLEIYKQWVYELIEDPKQDALKNLFEKQLIQICDEEDYQRLFTMLTCRRVSDNQGLKDWTVMKGRVKVFEQVVKVVENVLGYGKGNEDQSNINSNENSNLIVNLDQAITVFMQLTSNQTHINNPSSLLITTNQQQSLHQYTRNQAPKKEFTTENISSFGLRSLMYEKQKENHDQQISKKESPRQQVRQVECTTGTNNQNKRLFQNNYSDIIAGSNLNSANTNKVINNTSNIIINPSKYAKKSLARQPQQQQPQQLPSQELINEIKEEEHNDNTKIIKMEKTKRPLLELSTRKQEIDLFYNQHINKNSNQSHEIIAYQQHHQESQIHQNLSEPHIQYLQQTNSVVYNEQDKSHQNFTFSQHNFVQQPQIDQQKPKIIKKLAVTSDSKAIRTCQFSNSGRYFAVGTNSSVLKIFDVKKLYQENKFTTIKPLYEINNLHTKSIFCLDWSQDQQSIVTCSNDLTVKLTQFTPEFQTHSLSVIGRHQSCIRMVKYGHDQQKIFSCGDDGLVKVWDMGKVKRCYNLKGHNGGINAFKICEEQNQLYSVSKDATIKRWDLRSLQCIATSKSHESQITFIASNTQKIVVSNKSGNVLFYDTDLNFQYEVKVHEEEIRSIQAKKNEDLYITASFDGHVALFGQRNAHEADYFQHNDNTEDKVVFATFLDHPQHKGFASTSTLGLCHIYSYS